MATRAGSSSVRRKGHLYKLPVSGGLLKKWNKRWVVLHATSHEGIVRLIYFDDEESEIRGASPRTVNLRNCTGCCESTIYKSHPNAFQFTTAMGHHVFAAESHTDMSSWVEAINAVIKDDRVRQKKASSKTRLGEAVSGESQSPNRVMDHSLMGKANPSELMGTYRVVVEQDDTAKKLNLSGVYKLEINPRGVTLIASSTETTIAVWQYKHIKSYAKSKDKLTLQFGRASLTGAGKLTFQSSCTKELFGVLHRNIKKIKQSMEKAQKESTQQEVEKLRSKIKSRNDPRLHKGIRTKSMVYEVNVRPRPLHKRISCPDFPEGLDENLIALEGVTETIPEDSSFDPLNSDSDYQSEVGFASVLSSTTQSSTSSYDTLEPRLVSARSFQSNTSSSISEHVYDELPPPQYASSPLRPAPGFEDSFTTNNIHLFPDANPDPFANVSDPFSTAVVGSFYNSQEEHSEHSPMKDAYPLYDHPRKFHNSPHQQNGSLLNNGLRHSENGFHPVSTSVAKPLPPSNDPFNLEELDSELLEALNSLQAHATSNHGR